MDVVTTSAFSGGLVAGLVLVVWYIIWVGISFARRSREEKEGDGRWGERNGRDRGDGGGECKRVIYPVAEKAPGSTAHINTSPEEGFPHEPSTMASKSLSSPSSGEPTSNDNDTLATTAPIPSPHRNSLRRLSSNLLRTTLVPKLTTLFTSTSTTTTSSSSGRRNSDIDLFSPISPVATESTASSAPGFPAGFAPKTKEERDELGKYPDYERLSGVPWPNEYVGFDPERALPRPYRPFRWSYHQTMSLTKLEPDWWLELESTYKSRIQQRKQLYLEHGKKVLDWLPGEDVAVACRETMELVVMWLVRRYPRHFELVDDDDVECGEGDRKERKKGKVLVNHILGVRTPLDRGDMHPLHVLLDHVPEDFAIVLPEVTYPTATSSNLTGNTGTHLPTSPTSPTASPPQPAIRHIFRGGIICSAVGWNLGTKLGLTLHDIHHTTGSVPDYASKLSFSMDRFFTRNLPPQKPIQRGSWSLEIGQPLFIPPNDAHHLHLRSFQNPTLIPEDVFLRVDWQTLRRLPISGAVLFNYKAVFTPITQFREEPRIPALLGKVLSEGKRSILEYKGTWHVEHVVGPLMEEYARWQREEGGVLTREQAEEPIATLEQSPFFEGWEGRWREMQGF